MKKLLAFLLIPLTLSAQSVQITGGISVTGTLNASSLSCQITTFSLPAGQTGTAYSQSVTTSGCNTPLTFSIATGALPNGLAINSSTGAITGTPTVVNVFNFRVQLDSSSPSQTTFQDLSISITAPPVGGIISNSTCGTSGGGMDATAHLPNSYLCSSEADTPRTGGVVAVSPGSGTIQAAYNSASCGADLQLTAGGVYTGSLNLTGKSCSDSQWIWIRTAPSGSLPAEGTTTCPQYSGVSSLADYGTLHCAPSTVSATAKINVGSPILIPGDHIRMENLELANTGTTGINLVNTRGTKIVLDRIWFHGSPGLDTARAWSGDAGSNISIVDSYASDLHCTSVVGICSQGQAFNVVTGPGPYKLSHNFISAGGEQILFGGGGNGNGTPADIEVSYNHTFRPFTWNPSCVTSASCPGGVIYTGGGSGGHAYAVLNNIEFKNAQRVLVFGNVFENLWGGFSQVGNSITITPKNQSGTQCPSCITVDITLRFNLTKYAAQSWQIANLPANGAYATAGNSYSLHDNVYSHMNYAGCGAACSVYLTELATGLTAPVSDIMHDVTINHETHVLDAFNGSLQALGGGTAGSVQTNLVWKNSILPSGNIGIGNIGGTTQCAFTPAASVPKLTNCWNPLNFGFNLIPWGSGTSCAGHGCGGTWTSNPTPDTNIKVADQNSVGYTNLALDNYLLTGGSPGHNAASDGKDMGADITALNALIANVP